MWILLWIILSAVLIGATLWSFQILQRQKKAWEAYAKAKNFTFTRGTMMGPAEMNGVIGDYKVSFFTAQRQDPDIRTRRYVTVLEIDLIDGLVDGGAFGTQEMLPFLKSLDKLHPYKIEAANWEEGHFIFVKHDEVMNAYLTPERVEIVHQILKTRNADALMIFNDKEMILRLETSDPMQDPEKIDKIVARLIALTERLRASQDERKDYMALARI